MRDGFNAAALPTQDAAFLAFFQKHLNQVFGGPIAKQLPFVLFVKRDVVRLHQVNEILGGVTRQCTAAKVWVLAQEMFVGRAGIDESVGEVAPSAARDSNFFGDFGTVVNQQHRQAQLAGHASTKKTGSTGTYDDHITCLHAVGV
jgi:hypothetical protein